MRLKNSVTIRDTLDDKILVKRLCKLDNPEFFFIIEP